MDRFSAADVAARLAAVQRRGEAAGRAALLREGKGVRPSLLHTELRLHLQAARDARLIRNPPGDLPRLLQLDDQTKAGGEAVLWVGRSPAPNFKDLQDTPRITRTDGAWFDFAVTMRVPEGLSGLEILEYRFCLRFPEAPAEAPQPPNRMIRFDLNAPDKAVDHQGLRSHVHVNVDDESFAIPSPILSPEEVLDVILTRLQPAARPRHLTKAGPAV